MKVGISLKIDVTKIDKSRLYQGEKGKYLDITTIVNVDEKDQYDNNGFITQSTSKEEREAGLKLPILGNVKVFYKADDDPLHVSNAVQEAPKFDVDDIPF